MKRNQVGDVLYLTFPAFEEFDFVYHGFSTRLGGVSQGIYSSMNCSLGRGDDDENVILNFKKLCDAIKINPHTLVFSAQTHTSNILEVTKDDCGKGLFLPRTYDNIDGLITKCTDVTLVTFYADCVPIYFVDPVMRVVATAHAGWKGTVSQIARKMIALMKDKFSCDPKDIITGIGPSIGSCCFEVDENTVEEFNILPEHIISGCIKQRQDPANPDKFKYDIDLQRINKNVFLDAGIINEHINVADLCTKCNSDLLFSHRATNGQRGGMVAIIGMRDAM